MILKIFRNIVEKLYFKNPDNIAMHDVYTGLLNRNWWEIVGKHMYDNKNVYITMIDINNLKTVNDSIGHVAGDKFLMDISRSIAEICDKNDVFVRLGGDEFLLITSTDPGQRLINTNGDFCFGAYCKLCNESIHHSCKEADRLMYKMKKRYKENYVHETREKDDD